MIRYRSLACTNHHKIRGDKVMRKYFNKLKKIILKNQFGKSLRISVVGLILCLFSIILIVIKICTIRMKKYSSKKKKRVSELSITPMQYDSLDKFIKK